MNLVQSFLRPGKIRKVINQYGVIKCSAIGIFKDDEDLEKLPPVYPSPFMKTSATAFAQPHEGDDIWVMFFKDNPQMIFYSFQGNTEQSNADDLDNNYDDVEILSKRNNGSAAFMYDSTDGWTIKNDDCFVNLCDTINISNGKRNISIDNDTITLGSNSDAQPMVLGNELKTLLQDLESTLQNAASAAMNSPMTMPIGLALQKGLVSYKAKLQKILSKENYLS